MNASASFPPRAPGRAARLRASCNMKEQLGLLVLLLPFCANALSVQPAGLWRNLADREMWYDLGKAHWERAQATNDGVTSGIGPLHDVDIADSRRFLTAGEAPLWPSPTFRAGSRALDIGAGIGRVSDVRRHALQRLLLVFHRSHKRHDYSAFQCDAHTHT